MAFSRIVLGWAAVTLLLVLWHEAARRIGPAQDPPVPGLKATLPALVIEALLLTLFAGLWFGSLGSGGAVLLFLVVGALMEVPHRLRSQSLGGLPWKQVAVGVVRVMAAGLILSLVIG